MLKRTENDLDVTKDELSAQTKKAYEGKVYQEKWQKQNEEISELKDELSLLKGPQVDTIQPDQQQILQFELNKSATETRKLESMLIEKECEIERLKEH
jgi:hypothetical protein